MENLGMMHAIYKNKRVLITGHTGFKGTWLSLMLHEFGAEVAGYSLAPEDLSHFNLLKLKIKNYINDINNEKALEQAMLEFRPDIVFHLAAQSLVRESYYNPINTYNTNVLGSLKVYLAALKAGVGALVSVTTDKVYDNKEWIWGYRENDQLGGHDPYSSSKACVELMTASFQKSFLSDHKMLLATARAGNVIGGGDWARDRIIPDLVRNAATGNVTPIRNPQSIRPWQHVLDPLNGYLILGEKLLEGKKEFCTNFNLGPYANDNLTVKEICDEAKATWSKIHYQVESNVNNPHEAGLLSLDITKAMKDLNWKPCWSAKTAIKETVSWYEQFYKDGSCQSLQTLTTFLNDVQHVK